jgi:hypothetical protein
MRSRRRQTARRFWQTVPGDLGSDPAPARCPGWHPFPPHRPWPSYPADGPPQLRLSLNGRRSPLTWRSRSFDCSERRIRDRFRAKAGARPPAAVYSGELRRMSVRQSGQRGKPTDSRSTWRRPPGHQREVARRGPRRAPRRTRLKTARSSRGPPKQASGAAGCGCPS